MLHLLALALTVASPVTTLGSVRRLIRRVPIRRRRDGVDRFQKVILPELVIAVEREVDAVATLGKDVMLQRRGAVVGVHEVARVFVRLDDPLRELLRVRDRRG